MRSLFERLPRYASRALEISANWLCNRLDPPTVVLLYHRVTELETDPLGLAVSPRHFREQLLYLKERFPFRRFEEPWPRDGEPSVVITFDDGYADNLHEALPILAECGVPATFFVSTETIGTKREYWWDDLERLIRLPERLPERFESADPSCRRAWMTGTAKGRERFYWEMQTRFKRFDFRRREAWLRSLREWAGLPEDGRATHRPLTLAELTRLAEHPLVTIGAHTITHTRLSVLPPEVQAAEIQGSKEQLELWLRRPITVFSYPFGERQDFGRATLECCRDSFEKSATTRSSLAHSWSDRHRIPRRYVGNSSQLRFCLL